MLQRNVQPPSSWYFHPSLDMMVTTYKTTSHRSPEHHNTNFHHHENFWHIISFLLYACEKCEIGSLGKRNFLQYFLSCHTMFWYFSNWSLDKNSVASVIRHFVHFFTGIFLQLYLYFVYKVCFLRIHYIWSLGTLFSTFLLLLLLPHFT